MTARFVVVDDHVGGAAGLDRVRGRRRGGHDRPEHDRGPGEPEHAARERRGLAAQVELDDVPLGQQVRGRGRHFYGYRRDRPFLEPIPPAHGR